MIKLLWKEKKLLLVLLALAFLLRLLLLAAGLGSQGSEYFFAFDDARGYVDPALQVLQGRGYTADYNGTLFPETARTPGYPLLIIASLWLFGSYIPLIVLQLFLGSFVLPFLAYSIVQTWWEDRRAAYAAAIATAFEPLTLISSSLLLTETVFIAVLWGVLLLVSTRRQSVRALVAAGAALGMAALIKPLALYMIPILGAWILGRSTAAGLPWKRILLLIVVFAISSGVIFGPWMARNYYEANLPSLSSYSSLVPYYFTGSSILSLASGMSFADARQELRDKARRDVGIQELRDPRYLPYYAAEAKRIIAEHPKEFLMLIPLSMLHFFTHDGYLDAFTQIGLIEGAPQSSANITLLARGDFGMISEILRNFLSFPWVLFVLARILWGVIFILALVGSVGLLYKNKTRRIETLFAIAITVLFAFVSSLVGLSVTGRLRIPVNFILVAFAVFGIRYSFSWFKTLLPFRKYASYSSNN